MIPSSDNTGTLMFNPQTNEITINKPTTKKPLSFSQWAKCYRSFICIYIATHTQMNTLTLLQDLFVHHDTVEDLYLQGGQWWDYDVSFRQSMASGPFRWSLCRYDLLWKFGQKSSPALVHQNPTDVKKPEIVKKKKTFDIYVPIPHCRHYHNFGKCEFPKCQYDHSCYLCAGEHPVLDCKFRKKSCIRY